MDARVKQIFEHFGLQTQLNKLDEELKEFSIAARSGVKTDIIDEASDILIMAFQIFYMHKIKTMDVINRIDYKLDRTIERMESGYYEVKEV